MKERDERVSLWEKLLPGVQQFSDQPLDEKIISAIFYVGRIAWFALFCFFLFIFIPYLFIMAAYSVLR